MPSPAEQYFRTQVASASPLELVVMLYDAALRSIAAARDAMQRGDIPARRDAISKALAILNELQTSLDLQQGGAIAEELDRLYGWTTTRLLDAVARREAAPLDEVHRVLSTLRDGWQAIASPGAGARA